MIWRCVLRLLVLCMCVCVFSVCVVCGLRASVSLTDEYAVQTELIGVGYSDRLAVNVCIV